MKRFVLFALAVVATVGLLGLAGTASAQSNATGSIGSTVIPASQSFACGAGFGFTSFGITTHGNLLQFQSPAGFEHILVALLGSGYQVSYRVASPFVGFTTAYDFGFTEAGWSPFVGTSQPNGPNTFPLEITRTTADGRVQVTRRVTGNSFVGPAPVGSTYDNVNFNGQGCDVLGECGNCTNRTVHILTRVTNVSFDGAALFDVRVLEAQDYDVNASASNDRGGRTADSAFTWKDRTQFTDAHGMLLQTLILPAVTGSQFCCGYMGAPDPGGNFVSDATPTGPFDDPMMLLRQEVGTLGPGASSGNNVRIHVRRF